MEARQRQDTPTVCLDLIGEGTGGAPKPDKPRIIPPNSKEATVSLHKFSLYKQGDRRSEGGLTCKNVEVWVIRADVCHQGERFRWRMAEFTGGHPLEVGLALMRQGFSPIPAKVWGDRCAFIPGLL